MKYITLKKKGVYDYKGKDVKNTSFTLKGNNIVLLNVKWENIDGKCLNVEGDNCEIKNCNLNGTSKHISQMMVIKGYQTKFHDNIIENIDKTGCCVCVVKKDDKPNSSILYNNIFRNRKEVKGVNNGLEMVRIYDSNTSLENSNCILYNNHFYDCDGEIEVVSVKACGNIISYNKFFNCKGGLCLRHGNNNNVSYNYIDCNRKKGSAGIRVCGSGHSIKYNVIENNIEEENFYRMSMVFMNGQKNNKLNGYAPISNVLIHDNDFLSCFYGLAIGVNNKSSSNIKPKELVFSNNRFVKCRYDINTSKQLSEPDNSIIKDNLSTDKDVKLKIINPVNLKIEQYENLEILYGDLMMNGEKFNNLSSIKEEDEEKEDTYDNNTNKLINNNYEENKTKEILDKLKTYRQQAMEYKKDNQELEEIKNKLKILKIKIDNTLSELVEYLEN